MRDEPDRVGEGNKSRQGRVEPRVERDARERATATRDECSRTSLPLCAIAAVTFDFATPRKRARSGADVTTKRLFWSQDLISATKARLSLAVG
jgi:hypothetical protein